MNYILEGDFPNISKIEGTSKPNDDHDVVVITRFGTLFSSWSSQRDRNDRRGGSFRTSILARVRARLVMKLLSGNGGRVRRSSPPLCRRHSTRRVFRIGVVVSCLLLLILGIFWSVLSSSSLSFQRLVPFLSLWSILSRDFATTTPSPPTNVVLLSTPEWCSVSTDVRGNLGPASVLLIQANETSDWLHDRWQAASDMGGTAIQGVHWVQLDFATRVTIHSVVLDWETAYSDHYQLQVPRQQEGERSSLRSPSQHEQQEQQQHQWESIFEAPNRNISVHKYGTSPGYTKTPMPLHVVHTFSLPTPVITKSVRLLITKSVTGWGVSLWSVQLIGTRK